MIGETISHYRITEKLGEGGMGVVYKAEDLKLGRAVALKFLPPHLLESEEHKARFLHEARAVAALDHPTICTIHEIDEAEGRTFLAMAWLQGATLKKKIAQRPLPLGEALDIAIQIGQGLRAAHGKGVVHRDVKPANIMITTESHAKIMDFGLAQLGDCTKLTATGTKLGTPAYMSPEQTEGKSTDQRCDIWALGVVLYEMATGQLPFKGEAEAALAYAIVHTDPEPLTALRSGLPIELDRIVEKALAKAPAERYQHIEDMVVDLMRLRQVLDSAPRRQPVKSRRPWAIALGLLGLGVAITYAIFQRSDAPTPFEGWRVRRITTTAALELGASASPQSNLVAYSGAAAGNFDIYVMPASGGEPHQLTTHVADDTYPRFSPDGQQIAFLSGRDGGAFI